MSVTDTAEYNWRVNVEGDYDTLVALAACMRRIFDTAQPNDYSILITHTPAESALVVSCSCESQHCEQAMRAQLGLAGLTYTLRVFG
jgi:hypothetical protein